MEHDLGQAHVNKRRERFARRLDAVRQAMRTPDAARLLGLRGRGGWWYCPRCQRDHRSEPAIQVRGPEFRCKSCGARGDLIRLVRLSRGCGFEDAANFVAAALGLERPGVVETRRLRALTDNSVAEKLLRKRRKERLDAAKRKLLTRQNGLAQHEPLAPARGARQEARPRSAPTDPLAARFKPIAWSNPTETRLQALPDAANLRSTAAILEAFLDMCPFPDGVAFNEMSSRGIDPDTAFRLGLRFCSTRHAGIIERLQKRFGARHLLEARLLEGSAGALRSVFLPCAAKRVGFFVVAYRMGNRTAALRAWPLAADVVRRKAQVPALLTAGEWPPPCVFNFDVLAGAEQVLVCRGEMETLSALSLGFTAVGAAEMLEFRREWVRGFEGKRVFVLLREGREAREAGARIAGLFEEAGMEPPRTVELSANEDVRSFLARTATARRGKGGR